MNKDEMIKDVCRIMLDAEYNCHCISCNDCPHFVCESCNYAKGATDLYNAGYRKVAEDEIVIKKSEYENLSKDYATINNEAYYCGLNVGREETAREILQIVDGKLDLYRNGVIGGTLYDVVYKSAVNEIKIAIKNKYGIELE